MSRGAASRKRVQSNWPLVYVLVRFTGDWLLFQLSFLVLFFRDCSSFIKCSTTVLPPCVVSMAAGRSLRVYFLPIAACCSWSHLDFSQKAREKECRRVFWQGQRVFVNLKIPLLTIRNQISVWLIALSLRSDDNVNNSYRPTDSDQY